MGRKRTKLTCHTDVISCFRVCNLLFVDYLLIDYYLHTSNLYHFIIEWMKLMVLNSGQVSCHFESGFDV